MQFDIPKHRIKSTLKESNPGDRDVKRIVYRTDFNGMDCVTRVMLQKVRRTFEAKVREYATTDHGDLVGLDNRIQEILAGYNCRSKLKFQNYGIPVVVNAGLASLHEDPSFGYPYVTTQWVPGQSLEQLSRISLEQGKIILFQLLKLLERLHHENVVYGDLKPENVVVNGKDVSLIDLDTLRKVPNRNSATICTHLTEQWSAPEQQYAQPYLCLASDLYSFGLLVNFVLGNQLSPIWSTAVDACLRPIPLDRPDTSKLCKFLEAGVGELRRWNNQPYESRTEHVEDSLKSIDLDSGPGKREVPTDPLNQKEVVPPPGPTNNSERHVDRRMQAVAIAIVALFAVALSAVIVSCLNTRAEANRMAHEAWQGLMTYKTDPYHHSDVVLSGIVEKAEEAVRIMSTGYSVGVLALARVWHQGWTKKGTVIGWSESRYLDGIRITSKALKKEKTPEALLARGIVHAGACRMMPATLLSQRKANCQKAVSFLDIASKRNGRDRERDWLEVEIQWIAAISESRLAGYEARGEAEKVLRSTVERCEMVRPRLRGGPINDLELVKVCLTVAGPIREFRRYLVWSDWMVEKDIRTHGHVTRVTKQLVVISIDLSVGI